MVESIFPENCGAITLTDDLGVDVLTIFGPPYQWLALYRVLPKAPNFRCDFPGGRPSTRDPEVIRAYVAGFEASRPDWPDT